MNRGSVSLRLDHVAIAVADLEEAVEVYERLLGTSASAVEEVAAEGVRVAFFDLGGSRLELLAPAAADSPVRKFLDRGHRGVHHIALAVEGTPIEAVLRELQAAGVEIAPGGLRAGSGGSRVFFLAPRAASGVLIEFTQRPPAS